jgi:two-component system chemotaxis response regulator CheY
MEFTPPEIDALIDAIALRTRLVRKKLDESATGSNEFKKYQDKLKTLGPVLKKFIPLQVKKEQVVAAADEPEAAPVRLDLQKRQMLVVDDDRVIRQMIRSILEDHGCKMGHECADGHEAIAKIKGASTPYDMVFCDLNMPIMSGLDVLRVLRQSDEHKKLPFVMVTSTTDKKFLKEAIQAGVSDFIVKPVEEAKLIGKVGPLLK